MADQPQIMDLRTFGRTMLGRQPGYKPTKQELAADIALYKQYQTEAVKQMRPGMEPEVRDVPRPDGSTVPMYRQSAGSWQLLPDSGAPKFERITSADGTVKLIDTMTGKAITAWDEQTGKPIKAATKDTQDSVVAMQQAQLQQDIAKMQASGAPWYRSDASYQKDIAIKQAQLSAMMDPTTVLHGSPAPSSQVPAPAATPAPSPTPQVTPTPDGAFLSTPMPTPAPETAAPEPTPAPTPISMSSADYQSKYGRAMKPGRYRTKSGAEVLITD
jgi:hypothetical protein